MPGFVVPVAVLAVLAGLLAFSNRPGLTATGVPVVASVDQYRTTSAQALQDAQPILDKLEAGQELTAADRSQLEELDKIYDSLNQFNPTLIEPFFVRGRILAALDRNEAAEAAFSQAILNSDTSLEKAKADQDENRKRAIVFTMIDAYDQRARIRMRLGRNAEAWKDADFAVRNIPNSPVYLVTRASALNEVDRPKEALADINAALQLDPDNKQAKALKSFLEAED